MEVTNKKKGNNMGQLISAQNKEFIQQFDVQKVEMEYLYQALNVEHPELLDLERDAKRIEECDTELGRLKSKVADPEVQILLNDQRNRILATTKYVKEQEATHTLIVSTPHGLRNYNYKHYQGGVVGELDPKTYETYEHSLMAALRNKYQTVQALDTDYDKYLKTVEASYRQTGTISDYIQKKSPTKLDLHLVGSTRWMDNGHNLALKTEFCGDHYSDGMHIETRLRKRHGEDAYDGMIEVWPENGGIIETVFIENCDLNRVLSAIEESPHMSFEDVDYITIKGETDVNSQPEVDESINTNRVVYNEKNKFYTYNHKQATELARDILLQTHPVTKTSPIYQQLIGGNLLKRITYRDIDPVEAIIPSNSVNPVLIGLDRKTQKYVEITEQGKNEVQYDTISDIKIQAVNDSHLLEFIEAGGREGSWNRVNAIVNNPKKTADMNLVATNTYGKLVRQFDIIDNTVRQQFFGEEKFDNHMLVTKVTQLENNKYNMVSALFPIQPGIPIDNKIRAMRTTHIHEVEGINKIRNITSVAGVDVAENISLDEAFDYINNIRQEVRLIDQEPEWDFANEDNLER